MGTAGIIALSDASPADLILALAGHQQQILAHLEDQQAATMVQAWQDARAEMAQRMEELYHQTFGSGIAPDPRHVIEWTQKAQMLETIDGRLDDLGIATQTLQGSAWSSGAALGWEHANAALGVVSEDFGGAEVLGKVSFGALDTLSHDLAMTAAVNETKNLAPELRTAVHQSLITGATKGEGIRDLTKRLDPILGGATVPAGNRAELISRWSTIKGYGAATDDALNDAATVIPGLQKMWLVQSDERTCPNCLAHMGETVSVDGEFDKGRTFASSPIAVYGDVLEYPPLHPRCRCTITAWHDRWASLSKFTPDKLAADAQEAAQAAGFVTAPKPFTPPPLPTGLRSTRAGRRVLNAVNIAQIPDSVRQATIEKYLACQGSL